MPVRIRLARFGRRNLPFYRIFVADSRSPRDGRHLEVVGHYDPLPGACHRSQRLPLAAQVAGWSLHAHKPPCACLTCARLTPWFGVSSLFRQRCSSGREQTHWLEL